MNNNISNREKILSSILLLIEYIKTVSASSVEFLNLDKEQKELFKTIHSLVHGVILTDTNVRNVINILFNNGEVAVSLVNKIALEFKKLPSLKNILKNEADKVLNTLKLGKELKENLNKNVRLEKSLAAQQSNQIKEILREAGYYNKNYYNKEEDEIYYKKKALKYKNKYLQLKKTQNKL